jgi:uncharacterized protein YbjT (DUF2867 family)
MMRIVFAGASGLVGRQLLALLGRHDVTLLARREFGFAGRQRIGPADGWPALIAGEQFDAAISTLGTTIRQAGSRQAFAALDRDAVAALARAARECGARRFLIVSSVGADPVSPNFYLRTKGEAEAAVKAAGFDRVDIFRPGLLRGDRPGVSRPMERLMMTISPVTDLLTPAVLDRYRSIAAADVARAMAATLSAIESGVHVHHNRDMLRDEGGIG